MANVNILDVTNYQFAYGLIAFCEQDLNLTSEELYHLINVMLKDDTDAEENTRARYLLLIKKKDATPQTKKITTKHVDVLLDYYIKKEDGMTLSMVWAYNSVFDNAMLTNEQKTLVLKLVKKLLIKDFGKQKAEQKLKTLYQLIDKHKDNNGD